jgi:TolB-like protein
MQAGSRIGPFELLEVIGRGGMGEVWRAYDTRLERDVALKTLPDHLAADAASIARLEREARLLATLNHPNIAAILGLEKQDGLCWLVLELVDGISLEEHLRAGGLALPEATDIALQVAAALQAAHSRGIVHCDLKPSNIKVSAEGRIKVLDFGISRSQPAPPQSDATTLTAPRSLGEFAGTPAYMSPEQTRGDSIGPTSDIWAFGVLLYRMLAGRLPFAGPTTADTVAQVLQSEPDLSPLRPHVPDGLVRLLHRCLEKEPRRRIQHAGDLQVLIEEALVAAPISIPSATLRRRRSVIAIICVAALIAGGLVWHFYGRTQSQAPVTAQIAGTDASIAVLPFVNMSADPEQEYFSDGLSEEIINQLAQVQGLHVVARTSAFPFKGRTQDLRQVGQALGVAHILEGSVRKSGGRIRITAQLINVKTGFHVWSETFDRAMNDVFAIQDEIGTTVASKMGPTLGVVPRMADYGGTRSFEAYDHLLRGVSEFNKFSRESQSAAADEFRAALAVDPTYARASAELVIALNALKPETTDATAFRREVEGALAQAVRYAPDAPLTHVAKMWTYANRHEWKVADASCRAAFAGGHDPRAKWICGGFLNVTGRARAARPYREAGRQADPLSIITAATVVRQYAILGMGLELQREFARLDGLTGSRWQADEAMLAYLAHTRAPQEQISARLARACENLTTPGCEAWTIAIRTPDTAPNQLRSLLRTVSESAPRAAASIALAAAYRGETSLALDALAVVASRANSPVFQNFWYPLLGTARQDVRFKRIVSDLGFVDLWRSTGSWADFCQPVGADDFKCS